MDRTAVRALKRKGLSNTQIGEQIGAHRNTVSRLLKEPATKAYERKDMPDATTPYFESIKKWLEAKVPIKRMLELVRADSVLPYDGSRSAFYFGVRQLRMELDLVRQERWSRFEGLPGEYAQVDWGEVRNLPFTHEKLKRYFLAVRLKFSRAVFVKWTTSMDLETLLRGLVESFIYFGGVPWILVFDNMKTVTSGRDDQGRPIWHPVTRRFAEDFGFKPEACSPNRGNQKGAVESLVGWTKSNFVPERSFTNDEDLDKQSGQWLTRVNREPSQAHGEVPWELLAREENHKLLPLGESAHDYPLTSFVTAGGDAYVRLKSVHYLVPIGYARRSLVLKLRTQRVEFWDGDRCVAEHERKFNNSARPLRVTKPEYLEPLFKERPRARVMVIRDFLRETHPQIGEFIANLCQLKVGDEAFGPHILALYSLYEKHGVAELAAACSLATTEMAFGHEYVQAILQPAIMMPVAGPISSIIPLPAQGEVERSLATYEPFVRGGSNV